MQRNVVVFCGLQDEEIRFDFQGSTNILSEPVSRPQIPCYLGAIYTIYQPDLAPGDVWTLKRP